MGMERVLSIGERLKKIMADAEAEATFKINEAQSKADEKISTARNEANRKRTMAQRGTGIDELLKEEEAKAEIEAKKILDDYESRSNSLSNISENKKREAIEIILKEVLPI
jgi:vacuolar-type H+-ATPase subunit H